MVTSDRVYELALKRATVGDRLPQIRPQLILAAAGGDPLLALDLAVSITKARNVATRRSLRAVA